MLKHALIGTFALALAMSPSLAKNGESDAGGKGGESSGGKGGGRDDGGGREAKGEGSSGGHAGAGTDAPGGAREGGGTSSAGSGPGGAVGAGSAPGNGAAGSSTVGASSGGITTGGVGSHRGGSTAVLGRNIADQPDAIAWLREPGESNRGEVSLPESLSPITTGSLQLLAVVEDIGPVRYNPGTPPRIVQACRTTIASAARRYGAVRVDVASAGPTRTRVRGELVAPVEVRILYERGTRTQVRHDRVSCQFDQRGRVVALR